MAIVTTKKETLYKASDSTHHIAYKIKTIIESTSKVLSSVSSKCKDSTFKKCEKEINKIITEMAKPISTLEQMSAVLYTKYLAIEGYEEA